MVNYCCVYGCGRNSKTHEYLSFYSIPSERHRQTTWLKLAGREDLINAKFCYKSRRICSRHFKPSNVKNKSKHLAPDVVPTLYLPGQWSEEKSDDDEHTDIVCNSCKKSVVGFRYKCVTCDDYDLCQMCEAMEAHRQHFMLRIPKPLKFKLADNLIKKWRKFFNAEHVTPDALDSDTELTEDSSDDDQPITKYAKNYDSGVDLSEDVKETIRKEVQRVTNLKLDQQKKVTSTNTQKKKDENKRQANTKGERNRVIIPNKRMKVEEGQKRSVAVEVAPEVVFADVNNIKDHDLKSETMELPNIMPVISAVRSEVGPSEATPVSTCVTPTTAIQAVTYSEEMAIPGVSDPTVQQPVMHVKLSDDLTELMIEVANNNQKTFFKYPVSGSSGN